MNYKELTPKTLSKCILKGDRIKFDYFDPRDTHNFFNRLNKLGIIEIIDQNQSEIYFKTNHYFQYILSKPKEINLANHRKNVFEVVQGIPLDSYGYLNNGSLERLSMDPLYKDHKFYNKSEEG